MIISFFICSPPKVIDVLLFRKLHEAVKQGIEQNKYFVNGNEYLLFLNDQKNSVLMSCCCCGVKWLSCEIIWVTGCVFCYIYRCLCSISIGLSPDLNAILFFLLLLLTCSHLPNCYLSI